MFNIYTRTIKQDNDNVLSLEINCPDYGFFEDDFSYILDVEIKSKNFDSMYIPLLEDADSFFNNFNFKIFVNLDGSTAFKDPFWHKHELPLELSQVIRDGQTIKESFNISCPKRFLDPNFNESDYCYVSVVFRNLYPVPSKQYKTWIGQLVQKKKLNLKKESNI